MRFSPVLLAVCTVSAAVNLSRPVGAQSLNLNPVDIERAGVSGHSEPVATTSVATAGSSAPASLDTHSSSNSSAALNVGSPIAVGSHFGVQQPESFPPEFQAQAPTQSPPAGPSAQPSVEPSPAPGGPPPTTQTPIQEGPNEIRLDTNPPPQPSLQIEGQPFPQPASPTTPPAPGQPQAPGAEQPPLGQPVPGQPPTGQPVPGQPPTGQPAPGQPAPGQPPTGQPPTTEQPAPEPRVFVAEVAVTGVEGQLRDIVYRAIQTRPQRTTTRSQLQQDINAIFATGYFANVQAVPEDTPLGVRVTFLVQANPVLRSVRIQGNQVLPQSVVDQAFSGQYGSILNLRQFQEGVNTLNKWYQDNGYVLAQIVGAPQVAEDGTVTLEVAEGVIENIQVQFLNSEGQARDERGNPVRGRTREFIITREFETKPGDVFNRTRIQSDLQRVFGLGIFEDVRLSLNPGQDPRKVDVIVNVTERNTGSLAAAVGFSSDSGIFGSVSYREENLGGNDQQLGAEVQLGERDQLLFDLSFTDPWIAGDPYHTSYTVNAFSRRSISLIFDGGDREVNLPNGDRPRVQRLGGGVSFSRPLGNGWQASLGTQYQRVSIRDSRGDLSPVDEFGNNLSFSGRGIDDLLLVQFAAVRDRRNSTTAPTSGSVLRVATDQTVPIGTGSIFFNRVRASYSYYIPVKFTNFSNGPQALAFNIQAGTIVGDLPPYEAFSLGGTDSVRGYDTGELGSGRSFVQGTVEYRFPIVSIVGGALFADFGSDLGTGEDVPGRPAVIRRKPGSGFGVGAGVRIQSPLGQIRIDYGFNDNGGSQLHFGIGERF